MSSLDGVPRPDDARPRECVDLVGREADLPEDLRRVLADRRRGRAESRSLAVEKDEARKTGGGDPDVGDGLEKSNACV